MKNTISYDEFSQSGLTSLFEFIKQWEEDTGEEFEFDPIGICCDYREYENIEEFWRDYDKEDYGDIETISDHTLLIETGNGGFIITPF